MTNSRIKQKIRNEFTRWSKQPKIEKDWDLIWVLSGYDTSWQGSAATNDTRRRLEEGMRLAERIAALHDGAMPPIYISGYDEHNANLKRWRMEDFFEKKYAFPKKNLLVGPLEHIRHTGDQFEKFPKKFLKKYEKIVIVTDSYHMPRVERYLDKYFGDERDRFVLYPANPFTAGEKIVAVETNKIIEYAQEGIIPLFAHGARVKVVVTGASGFIGSHLLEALSRMPDLSITTLEHDAYVSERTLREVLRGAGFVIHLAGVRGDDAAALRFNVTSTEKLLKAIAIVAPRCVFVYASSFAVYRIPKKGEIIDENSPQKPRNAYGASKLAAERAIRALSERFGVGAVIVRFSNVYGRRQNYSATSFIDALRNAVRSGEPVVVRDSLETTRDFIYIDDVVAAIAAIIARLHATRGTVTLNICSGEETSFASLVRMVESVAGKRLTIAQESAHGNVTNGFWRGSSQKARKMLQWRPAVRMRKGLRLVFG